ncbi:hypothetical protein PMIT1327_00028 [Prochlorococcus marinus str. MIT 1327]|nr:hypothetical protein PMIT1312_00088 [Prochlorococcus marinus str. MIT 1312]KZR84980.1 hypothetical protein PMIT1327_00028 [Prochlorococcus marinus str. MIT 1327]
MDRTTNLKAMCAVNTAIERTPISDQNSLVSLRKAFYMHFIIESVLSERVGLIPASSLRETIS